ncbi:Phospholipase A2, major isoenzyme [Bulinus truncatus]|nr:Phospholipase A2, major isoenzyme [Bulinus truncatus]
MSSSKNIPLNLIFLLLISGYVKLSVQIQERSESFHASESSLSSAADVRRVKRNVFQLCRVINIYTGRSCVDYNNYGCFCGLRSRGSHPVDEVDRCCQSHDQCFSSLNCLLLSFTTYSTQCSGSQCTCTNSRKTSCRYRSCMCDLQFGECLQRARYNKVYRRYSTLRCH